MAKQFKRTRVFKYGRYWKLTYQCRRYDSKTIVSAEWGRIVLI